MRLSTIAIIESSVSEKPETPWERRAMTWYARRGWFGKGCDPNGGEKHQPASKGHRRCGVRPDESKLPRIRRSSGADIRYQSGVHSSNSLYTRAYVLTRIIRSGRKAEKAICIGDAARKRILSHAMLRTEGKFFRPGARELRSQSGQERT
jgi:hypothetical protein